MKTFQIFLEDVNSAYAQKKEDAEIKKQETIRKIIKQREEDAKNQELEDEIAQRLEAELEKRDKRSKK
jgi:isocitrate lyase